MGRKLEAERLALAAGAGPVVKSTTPSAMVIRSQRQPGPDHRGCRPRAGIQAYVGTTGLNVVDVRDVARGPALALERGQPGERYLLGGVDLPLEELLRSSQNAGRPRPRIRVPYPVAETSLQRLVCERR